MNEEAENASTMQHSTYSPEELADRRDFANWMMGTKSGTKAPSSHALLRGIHIYVPPYGVLFFVIGVLTGILLVTLGVGIVLNFM